MKKVIVSVSVVVASLLVSLAALNSMGAIEVDFSKVSIDNPFQFSVEGDWCVAEMDGVLVPSHLESMVSLTLREGNISSVLNNGWSNTEYKFLPVNSDSGVFHIRERGTSSDWIPFEQMKVVDGSLYMTTSSGQIKYVKKD